MESAKVFIDTDNEITFILEKILSSKAERVCLVVPDRASIFTSISGLKLIKRVVDKSNKLMILVTLDEHGGNLATKAGLLVVARVGEITEELWEQAQKSKFELMKKSSNKVFYTPEPRTEENTSEKEKKIVEEKIDLSDIIQKEDFVEGEDNVNINTYIPQISIDVKNEEINQQKIEEIQKEEADKAGFVEIEEDDKETVSPMFVENDKARVRRKSSQSPIKINFVAGYDLRSSKSKSDKKKLFSF